MAGEQRQPGSPDLSPRTRRHRRKERILQCLTRLGERDTQRPAYEELMGIIHELDLDGLSTLVSSVCQGKEQRPFARKECIKLFCSLCDEECPVRSAALQHPHLTRIVKHLRASFQDPDIGVQETAADVLGYLAANIADFSGGLLTGDSTNVIVRNIFEALQDPKKDAQLSASTALLRVAPSVGPMSKDYVKELLRCFKSNGFHAKSVLVSALAGWDYESGFPRGLFKNSTPSFKPYMNHIMGNPASASTSGNGLLSFLSSKEWTLRKACADALRAVVVVLGPEVDEQRGGMEGQKLSHRIRKALNQYRFDKVKPARDSILEALQAVHILQKYQTPDQSEEWLDFYLEEAAKAPTAGKCIRYIGSDDNEAEITPLQKAKKGKALSALRANSAGLRATRRLCPTSNGRHGFLRRGTSNGAVVPLCELAGSQGNIAFDGGVLSVHSMSENPRRLEWDILGPRKVEPAVMGVVASQNGRMSPGFGRQSAMDPNSALYETFKKAGAEEDVVATPQNSPPQMDTPEPESPSPRSDAIVDEDAVELGSANGDMNGEEQGCMPECQDDVQDRTEWAADSQLSIVADRLEVMERQQSRLFEMVSSLSNKIDTSVIGLQSEVTYLQQMVADFQDHMNAMGEGIRRAITPELGNGRAPSTSPSPPQRPQEAAAPQATANNVRSNCSTPSMQNLDAAYTEAMASPNNDLMLLRLLQRTGPILPELAPSTFNQLLRSFHLLLSEGTAIARILPWLWQLAEPENAACAQQVPEELKEKLIEVIGLLALEATDHQTTEQLKALESRLLSCWNQGNPMAYGAAASLQVASMNGGGLPPLKNRPPVPPHTAPNAQSRQSWLQSSAEGLDALKAQFSGMDARQAQR